MLRELLSRRASIGATLGDWIFGLCLMIFGIVYLFGALTLPDARLSDPIGHKAFPIVIASALVLLGASACLRNLLRGHRGQQPVSGSEEDGQEAQSSYPHAVLACAVGLGLFFFLLERIGFILSAILFLLAMTSILNRRRWILNLAVTILFPVFIYVVFTELLGVRLPAFPLL